MDSCGMKSGTPRFRNPHKIGPKQAVTPTPNRTTDVLVSSTENPGKTHANGTQNSRNMVLGLRQFSARTGEPVLDTDGGEELVHVQSSVSIALGNGAPESPGTLYITTKQVVWLSDVDRTNGYAVDFLFISLHAVSRDPEAYSYPCIYAQIETEDGEEESEGPDSESDEVLDLSRITEMRPIPSYAALCLYISELVCLEAFCARSLAS